MRRVEGERALAVAGTRTLLLRRPLRPGAPPSVGDRRHAGAILRESRESGWAGFDARSLEPERPVEPRVAGRAEGRCGETSPLERGARDAAAHAWGKSFPLPKLAIDNVCSIGCTSKIRNREISCSNQEIMTSSFSMTVQGQAHTWNGSFHLSQPTLLRTCSRVFRSRERSEEHTSELQSPC